MAMSAASSFISVLISGTTGVSTCWLASQSSTSTPEGVELFQLMPMTKKVNRPKCTASEKLKARVVLSFLVGRPRLKFNELGRKVCALFMYARQGVLLALHGKADTLHAILF